MSKFMIYTLTKVTLGYLERICLTDEPIPRPSPLVETPILENNFSMDLIVVVVL